MNAWQVFLNGVNKRIASMRSMSTPDPYFRGHADRTWKLEPGLSRHKRTNPRFTSITEDRLYWSFRMRGSHLLPQNSSGWTVLFYMQHYGLPTRLLDWSTNFANALFFAIEGSCNSPCVWILDPYALNLKSNLSKSISNINVSNTMDYANWLDTDSKPEGAVATEGDSSVDRIRSQGGAFTLHGDLDTSLEDLYPNTLTCHELPQKAIPAARQFLELAGVNDSTIFPDLSGLSTHLKKRELGNN